MILSKLGIIWTPFTCLTDELGQTSTPAGYLEASQINCSAIAKEASEISVFASKTKRGKKTLIFKYKRANDDSRNAEPVIEIVKDDTVRITVGLMETMVCRRERWERLTIEYRIGREFWPAASPPGNCRDD
jgi:hypothetical protein